MKEDPLASTASPDGLTSPALAAGHAGLARGAVVGRYVIENELGRGGMGVVYAARDPVLDRRIAIKLLRSTSAGARARLLREGQALARLRHTNVVTVYDLGEHGDDVFIAMELVEGTTLRGWWRARKRTADEVIDTLTAAGRGLAAAHAAGLVHRDFKPENVLVGRDGSVRVTDFGLARLAAGEVEEDLASADTPLPMPPSLAESPTLTRTGALMGTPAYMAPEQHHGAPTDSRTDQFSFCVVMWEALFGERPFADSEPGGEPSLEVLALEVTGGRIRPPPATAVAPQRLRGTLERGLQVKPAARFPTMEALLEARAPPPRRRRWLAAVGAVAAAGAITAIAWPRGGDGEPVPVAVPAPVCEHTLARMDELWSADARAAYEARAKPIEREQDLPWFDQFARRWTGLRRATCDRERAAAGAPGPELSREVACLDAALESFATAVARPKTRLWPALASLTRCEQDATAPPHLQTVAGRISDGDLFALAPDGARMASFTGGKLYVGAIQGADEHVFPAALGVGGIYWFGDGKRLLIHSPENTAQELDLATGTLRPLVDKVMYSAVSPDGTMIAYGRGPRLELRSLAHPEQPPRVLVETTYLVAEVAWSAEGDLVAAHLLDDGPDQPTVERTGIFHVASGKHIEVRHRLLYTGYGLAWLPGRRLLIEGEHDSGFSEGVWMLRLDERGQLIEAPELRIAAAERTQWQPLSGASSKALLVRSIMGRTLQVIAAGRPRTLPGRIGDSQPLAWDPVGRRLLVLRDDDSWGFLDPESGLSSVIDLPRRPTPTTRAGALLFLRARDGGWDLIERTDGGTERLLTGVDQPADARPPAVQCAVAARPVCALISHHPAGTLTIIDPDGKLTARPLAVGDWPQFMPSPDGRHLAAVDGNSGDIVTYDLRTLAVTRQHRQRDCKPHRVQWSHDSKATFVELYCGDHRIERRDANGTTVLLATTDTIRTFAVDDKDVVYASLMRFDLGLVLADGL